MQRRQYTRAGILKGLIILLTLAALADGYAFARAYAARNADTVVILATDYNNRLTPPATVPEPPILARVTQRYAGAIAHQIQFAIDTYPYRSSDYKGPRTCLTPATDHYYQYQFTFTLAGVAVEVAQTFSGGCSWSRTVLGLPEQAAFVDDAIHASNPLSAIYQATNGALPS